MPMVRAMNPSAPASPIRSPIRMHILPIVESADLVLPSIIDVRHLVAINVGPCRAIADRDVVAHVDLTNVDRPVIRDPDTRERWASRDAGPVVNPRAIVNAGTIAQSWPNIAGQCFWPEWSSHSQKVTHISRSWASGDIGWDIDVWPIINIPWQSRRGTLEIRTIRQFVARTIFSPAAQIRNTRTRRGPIDLTWKLVRST